MPRRTVSMTMASPWILLFLLAPSPGPRAQDAPPASTQGASQSAIQDRPDPGQTDSGQTAEDAIQALRKEVARLHDEIADLRRRHEAAAARSAGEAARREALESQRKEDEERIDELEGRIELLQVMTEEPPPNPPSGFPELPNVLNPRVVVFLNGTARADDRKVRSDTDPTKSIDNRFSLRETELDFRAAIDPFADGVLKATFGEESPGEFTAEVEEGYGVLRKLPLPFLERPPAGLTIKAGRFRTEFGRMNRLDTHDLPQVDRPLVIRELLGEDGSVGDGVSAQFFVPVEMLDEESTLRATVQAFTGALSSANDNRMQGLVNASWSRAFGESNRVDVAGIAHYGQSEGTLGRDPVRTYSAEAFWTWRPVRRATRLGAIAGGQFFLSDRVNEVSGPGGTLHTDHTAPRGWFVFGQGQFTRNFFAGIRYGQTETALDRSVEARGFVPYVSWYPTEFMRFRLAWEHTAYRGDATRDLNTLWFEINFIFGSHPAEPFWSNR